MLLDNINLQMSQRAFCPPLYHDLLALLIIDNFLIWPAFQLKFPKREFDISSSPLWINHISGYWLASGLTCFGSSRYPVLSGLTGEWATWSFWVWSELTIPLVCLDFNCGVTTYISIFSVVLFKDGIEKKARLFLLEKKLETTKEKGLNDRKIWETLQRPPKEDPKLNNPRFSFCLSQY